MIPASRENEWTPVEWGYIGANALMGIGASYWAQHQADEETNPMVAQELEHTSLSLWRLTPVNMVASVALISLAREVGKSCLETKIGRWFSAYVVDQSILSNAPKIASMALPLLVQYSVIHFFNSFK